MRNFIALIICGVLLLAGSGVFASVEISGADVTRQDVAVEYIKMLQIADLSEQSAPMSRGEAVRTIVVSLGLEEAALSLGTSGSGEEEKIAAMAHTIGILSGTEPAEWRLGDTLTLEQAAKMLVVALGYQVYVTQENAYPQGYLSYAARLKLTRFIPEKTLGETLAVGEFATMLHQALQTKLHRLTGIVQGQLHYKMSGDATLEEVYLTMKDWVKGRGVIQADRYCSIAPGVKTEEDMILINGVRCRSEEEEFHGYVGYEIDYVAAAADADGGQGLIGIRVTENNVVLHLDADAICAYKDYKLCYETDGGAREEEIFLDEGAVFIKNNRLVTSYTDEKALFSEGRFELIDHDGDGDADIIKCVASKSFIIDRVQDGKIYLKNGTLHTKSVIQLDSRDINCLVLRDLDGRAVAPEELAADDAISIIADEKFAYLEIILLQKKLTGRVEEISGDEVTIDSVVYRLADSGLHLNAGETYTFRINENNEIFDVEQPMYECVYLMDKTRESTGLDRRAVIKTYDTETGIRICPSADRVNINGQAYEDMDEIYRAIPNKTLVRVTLNRNGEFKEIKELESYGEEAVRVYCKYASGFNDVAYAASTPFRFDENTRFFTIPENGWDLDYGVEVELKDNHEYTTQAYEYDTETGAARAVVIKVQTDMESNLTFNSDVGIVSAISAVLAKDGQQTYKIKGYHEGTEFTYYAGQYDDVFRVCSTLRTGDVIRYIVNYSDEIVAVERVISLSDVADSFHDGKNSTDEQFFGRALMLKKNVMTNRSKYLYHQIGVSASDSYNNLVNMEFFADVENPMDASCRFADYYRYDRKRDKVTAASVDDIITYEMAGDGAPRLFILRSKADVRIIVIVDDE